MKILWSVLILASMASAPLARGAEPTTATTKAPNASPFFAFCMDTHDSKQRTLAEQAAMLQELGFDGAGHLWLDGVEERLRTLDAANLRLFQINLRINIAPDAPEPYEPKLREVLPLLKGRDVMLAPLLTGMAASDEAGDARAVAILHEIADMAQASGVRIALYHHVGDWCERFEDAVRIAKKVDRPNVGAMFNLCHWLKVDGKQDLEALLTPALPLLFSVSINGTDTAAEIHAGTGNWLQPLDSGSYDVGALVAMLDGIGYRGPVGLQCYGIPGDAREHMARSIAVWRKFTAEPKSAK